jgi:hypothetical protein
MNHIRILALAAVIAAGLTTQAYAEDSTIYKRAMSCNIPESAPMAGGFKFDLFGKADLSGTGATDVIYATGGAAPTLVNAPDGSLEILISAVVDVAALADGARALTFKFNVAGYDAVLRYNTATKVSTLAVGDPKQFPIDCKPLVKF